MNNKNLNVYKCIRIFNVLHIEKRKKTLLLLLIFNVIALFLLVYNKKSDSWAISFIVTTVAYFVLCIIEAPRKLSVGSDYIEFSETAFFVPNIPHVTFHGVYYPVKVIYRINKVRDVKLIQSPVERLFNVGRISFTGDVRIEAKRDLDRIDIKETFCIYGITKFDRFKKEFENKNDRIS